MAKSSGKKKHKIVMCRDYFGFGIFSMIAGTFFLAVTLLTVVTLFRILIVSFFLILGIIDLALYSLFRKR